MTIQKLAITTASVAMLTMAAAPALACTTKPVTKVTDHKVGICHATGSQTNPYVFIVVDKNAAQAHAKHQGDRDIIGVTSADKCPKPVVAKVTPKPEVTPTPTPEAPKPVTTGGQGQVLAASTEAAPTNLPDTGAGLSALLGLPTLALAGRAYLRSRKS